MRFRKTCIAMMIVVMFVITSVPFAVGSDEVNAEDVIENKTDEEISVWFVVTRGRDVLLPPTQITVTNFDPADYGMGHLGMASGINGGHVWIQSHIDKFGAENLASTMTVRADGFLLRFWDYTDGNEGLYISYLINNVMVAKCANWINMKEGMVFNLFFMGFNTEGYFRHIAFNTHSQTILSGETASVTLVSSSTDPDISRDDAPIYIYQEGGVLWEEGSANNPEPIGLTDRYGKFTHTFNEPGVYWLYTMKSKTGIAWTQVIVRDVYAESVEISENEATIPVNGTLNLTAVVSPSTADVLGVQWSSSQKSVASVSKDGTVTGLSPGRSIITARTLDGEHVASCEVTVKYDNVADTGNKSDGKIVLYAGIGAIGILAAAVIVFYYTRR